MTEAQEITADVLEDNVLYDQQPVHPKKVRPIQTGELLRKYVSRRLLALRRRNRCGSSGLGSQGGAEGLAIRQQPLYDEWAEGSLTEPPARIKVDEKNCFGMTEWKAVRDAASRFLPKPRRVGANAQIPWCRTRRRRRPLECSLALGMVAAETRGRVAAQHPSGSLPWIGVDDPPELQRLQAELAVMLQETANLQLGGPGKFTGARLAKNGGLADLWYPILVPSYLQKFDDAKAKVGAERNPQKTEVIHHVNDLGAAPPEWRIGDLRNTAKTSAVTDGSTTLGVAVGSRQFIADQLLACT